MIPLIETAYETTEEQIRAKLAELEIDLKSASKANLRQFIIDQIDELEERLRRIVRQRRILNHEASAGPPYYQEFLEKRLQTKEQDLLETYEIYVPHSLFKEFLDVIIEENKSLGYHDRHYFWKVRDGKPFVKRLPKLSRTVMTYEDFRGAFF